MLCWAATLLIEFRGKICQKKYYNSNVVGYRSLAPQKARYYSRSLILYCINIQFTLTRLLNHCTWSIAWSVQIEFDIALRVNIGYTYIVFMHMYRYIWWINMLYTACKSFYKHVLFVSVLKALWWLLQKYTCFILIKINYYQ